VSWCSFDLPSVISGAGRAAASLPYGPNHQRMTRIATQSADRDTGLITAKRGRAPSELTATSRSLALLTNVMMAHSASKMAAVDHKHPADYDPRAMQRVAPIGHARIKLRGTQTFDPARFRERPFAASRQRHAA
jgi:hypothetical protein